MDTEDETPYEGVGPGSALAGDPEVKRRKRSWPSIIGMTLVVIVVVGVLAGFVVRVDYTTIAPGKALSLRGLVTIKGAQTYPEGDGDLRLLFVREAYHVNVWQYVRARLDDDIDLAKDGAVNPGTLTQQQLNDQGFEQMDEAKTSATAVALRAAGYKVSVEPGLTVTDLFSGLPAIKSLYWGDVILTANDHKITDSTDLSAVVAKVPVGGQVALGILRGTKPMTVSSGVADDHGRHILGVEVAPRFVFPFKVNVDTTGIGGPSAGLAMTLAIFDELTSGDLTGGRNIAITGTIDNAGNVGEIGGIVQKAISARSARVSLFIVPQCSKLDSPAGFKACQADLVSVAKRVGSKIKVLPVATFAQALKVLRDNGGDVAKPIGSTTTTTTVPKTTTTTVPKTSTTIAA